MDMNDRVIFRIRDGQELSARRLRAGDAPALQTFHAALWPESRRHFLPHRYDDATLARALARSESGEDLVLGVFDGDRLVGYFFLWRFQERVPLLGIGILDEFHGRGLGTQMMEFLIRQARDTGREGIELTTMLDNHQAFALYRKVGFQYYQDVQNVTGDGAVILERGLFYEMAPGAKPFDGAHQAPV